MSRAFTRAEVAAMTPDQVAANLADVNEWVGAGQPEGQAAPSLRRPAGHTFTAAEVSAMGQAEFEANRDLIDAWLAAGGTR